MVKIANDDIKEELDKLKNEIKELEEREQLEKKLKDMKLKKQEMIYKDSKFEKLIKNFLGTK